MKCTPDNVNCPLHKELAELRQKLTTIEAEVEKRVREECRVVGSGVAMSHKLLELEQQLATATAERDLYINERRILSSDYQALADSYEDIKAELAKLRAEIASVEPVAMFQLVDDCEYQQVTDDEEYIKMLNIDMSHTFPLYRHPPIQEGKVMVDAESKQLSFNEKLNTRYGL